MLQGELPSRKGAICPDVSEFLTGRAAPYQQVAKSGDLEAEQGIRFMGVLQEEQEIVCFRIPLRNRKSLACSSVSVMEWISLCREEVIVKLMRSAEYFPYLYHTVADLQIDSW